MTDRRTDRRTHGHPKPIGPQLFGLGPNNVLRTRVRLEVPCTGPVPVTFKTVHCLIEKSRENPDSRRLWTLFGPDPIMPGILGCIETETEWKAVTEGRIQCLLWGFGPHISSIHRILHKGMRNDIRYLDKW